MATKTEKRLKYLNSQLLKRWDEPPCETVTQAEKRMAELKEIDHNDKISRIQGNSGK